MLTDTERKTLRAVVKKAWDFEVVRNTYADQNAIERDLVMAHAACPLDFYKLLRFPAMSFLHDILGIARHLNRTRKRIDDFFVPRCAKEEV